MLRCPCRPSWSNWWEERRKRKEKEKHDQKFRDQEAAIRQRNRNALLKMPASAFQGSAAEHSGCKSSNGIPQSSHHAVV